MDKMIKKCDKCGNIAIYTQDYCVHKSNYCNGNLVEVNISYDDFLILCDISEDNDFLQAMIDLKEKDIIEYNLKITQFKLQLEQHKNNKVQNDNRPKCPTCSSTNLKEISGLSKAGSVAMLGLLSQKVKKIYHCNSCGYEW